MILIFLNILGWIVVLIYLGVLALLFLWLSRIFQSKVPFSFVPTSSLSEINQALKLNDDSILYDLGCRDGRTLFYFSKFNQGQYFGIEDGIFSLLCARVNLFFRKNKKVIIINKNFFNYDLSKATHIFINLRPNIMDDLLPKFDNELQKGTIVVSLYFHFTSKNPIREIKLKKNNIRKLYIYEF